MVSNSSTNEEEIIRKYSSTVYKIAYLLRQTEPTVTIFIRMFFYAT